MESKNDAANANQHPQNKSGDISPNSAVKSSVKLSTDNNDSGSEKEQHSPPSQRSKYIQKWTEPLAVATILLVVVTGFLAYYTYQLFKDASTANERNKESIAAAKQSAQAATDAVSEQKKYNEQSLILQRQALDSAIAANKSNLNLVQTNSKKSDSISRITLQQQINALNENKRDFELESSAFVFPGDMSLDTFNFRFGFTINFAFFNAGKFPGKLTYYRAGAIIDNSGSNVLNIENKLTDSNYWYTRNTSSIITSGSQIGQHFRYGEPPTDLQYSEFNRGNFSIFFVGEVQYASFGVNKKYSLKFGYKITKQLLIKDRFDFQTIKFEVNEIN